MTVQELIDQLEMCINKNSDVIINDEQSNIFDVDNVDLSFNGIVRLELTSNFNVDDMNIF